MFRVPAPPRARAARVLLGSALLAWLAGWAIYGLPWKDVTRRPQFERVRTSPLTPLYVGRRDAVRNFVYYFPYGALTMALGWRPSRALAGAAVLSGVTEALQVFSPDRFPTTSDFVLNVAGAAAGMTAVGIVHHIRGPRDPIAGLPPSADESPR